MFQRWTIEVNDGLRCRGRWNRRPLARCQRKVLAGCVPGLNRQGTSRKSGMMELELRVHGRRAEDKGGRHGWRYGNGRQERTAKRKATSIEVTTREPPVTVPIQDA